MAFASREEYERWKAAKAAGLSPPLPAGAAGPAAAPAKEGFFASFEGLPKWSWAFYGACLVIPVVTRGGAIPAAIGLGGASVCASIAKKPDLSMAARVAICGAVTATAWGLLLALLAALGAARG